MSKKFKNNYSKRYIETPLGIVTSSGHWFHTTSDQIESYAPGLLRKYDLDMLVRAAEAWIKSADALALLLYLGLVFTLSPYLVLGMVLILHVFWFFNKSAFMVPGLTKLMQLITSDGTLLVASLVIFSWLGISERYTALGLGLILFFLLKLGLIRRLWEYLDRKRKGWITLNDRLLKMIILRYAMKENIDIEEVDSMDEQIRDLVIRKNKS